MAARHARTRRARRLRVTPRARPIALLCARPIALLCALTSAAGAACGPAGDADVTNPDPAPMVTADERAVLAVLAPASLPPPPRDVTNRVADDPAAAALGQRFFFDPGFSGPLLDGANDGTRGTLGRQGEPGRVACAGCHVPA